MITNTGFVMHSQRKRERDKDYFKNIFFSYDKRFCKFNKFIALRVKSPGKYDS